MRRLGPPAGVFLAELLAGRDAEAALARAYEAAPVETVLSTIQSDVFAAPFAAILTPPIQAPARTRTVTDAARGAARGAKSRRSRRLQRVETDRCSSTGLC